MPITLEELKERIATRCTEVDILELLEINSFDLVESYEERIEQRFRRLAEEFEDDENEESYSESS